MVSSGQFLCSSLMYVTITRSPFRHFCSCVQIISFHAMSHHHEMSMSCRQIAAYGADVIFVPLY